MAVQCSIGGTDLRSENQKRTPIKGDWHERKPPIKGSGEKTLGQTVHRIGGRTLATGGVVPGDGVHGDRPRGQRGAEAAGAAARVGSVRLIPCRIDEIGLVIQVGIPMIHQ